MKIQCVMLIVTCAVSGCFGGTTTEYYALLYDNFTLPCGEFPGATAKDIKWKFQDKFIATNDEYVTSPENLFIRNVTAQKYGKYECINDVNERGTLYYDSNTLHLRPAPPQIESNYKYYIYGTFNKTAYAKCEVISSPTATITWYRNGAEVSRYNDKYIVTIKHITTNGHPYDESTLRFHVSNTADLGAYTCEATNNYGTAKVDFVLNDLPVPEVHVDGFKSSSLQLRIQVTNPSASLSSYRIMYAKSGNTDESTWTVQDVIPGRETYSVGNLESNSEYNLRIGACFEKNRCAFNNTLSVKTPQSDNSSAMDVHSRIPFFLLLPAFALGYLSMFRFT